MLISTTLLPTSDFPTFSRVPDISVLWQNAVRKHDVDVVDIQSLIELKQTKRVRDYSIIGALAEVAGFNQDKAKNTLLSDQHNQLLSIAKEELA